MNASPGSWAAAPLRERLAWVSRFRRAIAAGRHELCAAIEEDTGKARFEALMSDVAPLLAACRWVERRAGGLLSDRRLSGSPWWLRGVRMTERRLPLGRVAIIAVWNYPVQTLGIQLIQALAAGNTVVVKPSERSPKSQARLIELAVRAGLPEGVLKTTAATREAGEKLLTGEHFDHIVFTGSTEVGKLVAAAAAGSLTPATLELSGRDSALVLDDANPVLAAESIWAGVCLNSGQTCMGPRRALVHGSVYKPFVDHLSKLARKTPAKPLIDESAARRCYELVVRAVEMGGRDAAAEAFGSPNPSAPIPQPVGRLWRPTAVIDCPRVAELVEGRHFGPALAVVRVERMEEALDIHDRCDQHLTASVYTGTVSRGYRLAETLGATNVSINDTVMPVCHPGVSIGGRGLSGMGLSRGEEGLLAMTRPVYISESRGAIRNVLMDPPRMVAEAISGIIALSYGSWRSSAPASPSERRA